MEKEEAFHNDYTESIVTFDAASFDFDAGIEGLDNFHKSDRDSLSVTSPECESPVVDFEIDTDITRLELPTSVSTDGDDWFDEHLERQRKERRTDLACLGAPKVLKNDIRRSFSKMFLNTINGGDFQMVQDFSTAFILPSSQFGASLKFNGDFGMPSSLHGLGPRALVHHLLGCFVMFPDMIGTMQDTQIITSNRWPGTKIVIPWDCKFTITHRIPTECWIPPRDKAELMYAEPSIECMMAALSMTDKPVPSLPPLTSMKSEGVGGSFSTYLPPVKKKRKRGNMPTPALTPYDQVPASYAEKLISGAAPVAYTPTLSARGSYTIMLDESNRVQSIFLDFHEVPVCPATHSSAGSDTH